MKIWSILKTTALEFNEDKVLRLSAALAYYSLFSIGPLLVIAAGVAGLAFGHYIVRHQLEQELQGMFGGESAKTIISMMSAKRQSTSLVTTLVGIVALLFGAGGVFGQLQDSLNTIWEVKAKRGAGLRAFIRARFVSFAMVLGTGFLLLVSLALTTFLNAATRSLGSRLPFSDGLLNGVNFVISFAVISALFAMIFKYLPDVRIPFRKVIIGAIGTAFLFTVGKYLLALYLGRETLASAYGAAGSLIVILLWVYYASLILFFGAEFTQVYTRQTGGKITLPRYAVQVTEEDRAQQGIPTQRPSAHTRHPREAPSDSDGGSS